jgi:hypothetical protein
MEGQTEEPESSPVSPPAQAPSDEEGYTTVPPRRRRTDRPRPTPNATKQLKVSENSPAGTTWRRTSEVPPPPQQQPQAGALEPARKPRIRPVIIRDSVKWIERSVETSRQIANPLLAGQTAGNFNAKHVDWFCRTTNQNGRIRQNFASNKEVALRPHPNRLFTTTAWTAGLTFWTLLSRRTSRIKSDQGAMRAKA